MNALRGHLDLLAATDGDGRTTLRRQSFAPPVHISKPHHDAGWLVVNMVSPSPGLLSGDRVDISIEVQDGAHLLLTSPSASRIHTMREGFAKVAQRFVIRSGGCFDYWPEYLIPQADSAYHQTSQIEVEEGGALLWTESIAPGRTARGEVFQFREMHIGTDIVHAGRYLLRERYRLNPGHPSIRALRGLYPSAYYASVVIIAPGIADEPAALAEMLDLHAPESLWLGVSRLGPRAFAVKVLANDSPALRSAVSKIRRCLQTASGSPSPSIRRVTGD